MSNVGKRPIDKVNADLVRRIEFQDDIRKAGEEIMRRAFPIFISKEIERAKVELEEKLLKHVAEYGELPTHITLKII